jgi:hypothetical protein
MDGTGGGDQKAKKKDANKAEAPDTPTDTPQNAPPAKSGEATPADNPSASRTDSSSDAKETGDRN